VVRDCFAPKARIGSQVPIWVTENGVPSAGSSEGRQAAALHALVRAVRAYSGTFNVTDYRWFNLRDSNHVPPGTVAPIFASNGLLRADYTEKPAFGTYRSLIAKFGARASSCAG
jgi:hypothetical protein